MLDPVQGSGDRGGHETDNISTPIEFIFLWGKNISKILKRWKRRKTMPPSCRFGE